MNRKFVSFLLICLFIFSWNVLAFSDSIMDDEIEENIARSTSSTIQTTMLDSSNNLYSIAAVVVPLSSRNAQAYTYVELSGVNPSIPNAWSVARNYTKYVSVRANASGGGHGTSFEAENTSLGDISKADAYANNLNFNISYMSGIHKVVVNGSVWEDTTIYGWVIW